MELGDSMHFRPVCERARHEELTRERLRGLGEGHHKRSDEAIFFTLETVKQNMSRGWSRTDVTTSSLCVGMPWQLRLDK